LKSGGYGNQDGGDQRLTSLVLRIPALGHSIPPHPLPVLEDGLGELDTKRIHLRGVRVFVEGWIMPLIK
jgi:hypothetical protein